MDGENKSLGRLKIVFIVITVSIIAGALFFFFKPREISVTIYPSDLTGNVQFSCTTKLGSSFFPRQNYKNHTTETVDGRIFSDSNTKLAIEIDNKTLKLITTTAVEAGMTKPAEFVILDENSESLVAVNTDKGLVDPGINTFILNKKTGMAVWTKSKPKFFSNQLPDVQSYYMECR